MNSRIMRFALCTTVMAALALTFSGAAKAQAPDAVFAISYYSNAHTAGAPDATLRLSNDGTLTDASPAGDLCAAIYVFDNSEEMLECCSCRVTPNGYLALSVNTNLTSNVLTGKTLTRGVIKVVSSMPTGGVCDPTTTGPNNNNTQVGIRGWLTHVQKAASGFQFTEEELLDSNLDNDEQADLAEDCQVAMELGSGAGVCSCRDSGK
jgi:hypothetical protein